MDNLKYTPGIVWGPAVRRSTAPSRPGVRKAELSNNVKVKDEVQKDEPLEKFEELQSNPSRVSRMLNVRNLKEDLEIPDEKNVKLKSSVPELSDTALAGCSKSITTDAADPEQPTLSKDYEVRMMNSAPLTLIEMKGSCKLDLEKCLTIKISNESTLRRDGKHAKPDTISKSVVENPVNSVYGQIDKNELKKSRLSTYMDSKKFHQDKLMVMEAIDGSNNYHKMEGRRQVTNNSSGKYFVLAQNPDGSFLARPVHDWIYMDPSIKYKTLTYEEADEEFERRHKVLNLFSVMVKKRLKGDDGSDEEDHATLKPKTKKKAQQLDNSEDLWISSESEDGLESQEKRCAISSKRGRKKRFGNEDDEEDTQGCSPIASCGESFSGSDSDHGDKTYEKRVIDEEYGMKKMLKWESSEESEEEKTETPNKVVNENDGKQGKQKRKTSVGKSKSGEKRQKQEDNEARTKRKKSQDQGTPQKDDRIQKGLILTKASGESWNQCNVIRLSQEEEKGKFDSPVKVAFTISKALRNRAEVAGLTEETIKRYLRRKPTSIKELCQKFIYKTRQFDLTRNELSEVIAHLLSVINPAKQVSNDTNLFYIPTQADHNSVYLSMISDSKSNPS